MRKKKISRFLNSLCLFGFIFSGVRAQPIAELGAKTAASSETFEESPAPAPANRQLEKDASRVLTDRPWLDDLYSWNESFDLDHQQVKAPETGAYCVGNGRAFALVGLSSPLWNWSNLYGASYQEPDLGSMRMGVSRAGVEAWMPKQQIGWVKRSGVVKVHAEGKGLTVESFDFAPVTPSGEDAWDNPAVLVRMVHLVNTGQYPEDGLDIVLKIQSSWNVTTSEKTAGNDLLVTQKASRAKKRTFWRLGAFNPRNARIRDNNLHYKLPALQPGGETWAAFFLVAANSRGENNSETGALRGMGALALLDRTRDYYQKWFEQGTEFSGDPKTTDLFEIESMIFKSQQSHTGGFSPLIGYSYTWIRDNNGPIRWFLKTGHPEEARRAMDFFYGVGSTMGSLPNSIRVDYPLNYRKKDLSDMHVEHAETPNWIVLQYWWYYLTTGDIELIRARWNYLKRCVEGQVNVGDKYFFHRDETYLWCLESRCFDECPYPNYDLSTYAFAADSSFDVVAAADRLAYLGKFLEMDKDVSAVKKLAKRVRATAEETYWNEKGGYWAPAQSLLGPLYNAPYANILMNPFWCGYARTDLDPLGETSLSSEHAVEAIRNAYPWLGREDGFWKTTPTVDFFVGMNPGQLLVSLCKARLPWAEKAYLAVLKTATPSGEFAEMYDGKYRPWNPPAWGQGTSGRVRPWEGGLDTESILEFLTGFAPDAGNNRVVFSPHMPENLRELSAKRLLVGNSRVSLAMKRSGPTDWTFTLRLEKGPSPGITVDFWTCRRILANVAADGGVTWTKTTVETNGREARCDLSLVPDKDLVFTLSEDSLLPGVEITPPKPRPFQPDPYPIAPGNLLLLTSPSAIFNKHKNTPPANFPAIGTSELRTVERVTSSVSFLDMDLPISADDIARGLLDDRGFQKVRLAVLGRGAFSSGKHDFKPESYWADSRIGEAVRKFLEQGGCVFVGPSYPNREVLPDWLIRLTDGGWEEGTAPDKAVVAETARMESSQKKQDEIDVANGDSEKSHSVTFAGEILEDTQKLPDGQDGGKIIQDTGRIFNGYYEFTLKTAPGFRNRLWLRVNTGHNIKGMVLAVQNGGRWVRLGIRTKNDAATRHFQALYFDIPEKWVTSDETAFRLTSKTGDEINLYHLWSYRVEGGTGPSLPEILGYPTSQTVGEVSHGLIAKSKNWKSPFILSRHPEQSALIIQKIGNGYLVRSELALEDSVGILKGFLRPETLESLKGFFSGN